MDSLVGFLDSFLSSFSASYITEEAYRIGLSYMTTVSGTLLVISIAIRLSAASIESMDGQGKYTAFMKSLLIWGSMIGVYFMLAGIIIDFFNTLYAWSHRNGSVGMVLKQLGVLMEDLDNQVAENATEGIDVLNIFANVSASPFKWMSLIAFFFSFILVIALQLFLQVAQATAFAVAFIWGTIALPMAVSQKLSFITGWAKFSGTILIWPLIESLFMYLLLGVAGQASIDMIDGARVATTAEAGLYLLFGILNLIIAASIFAAPFVAYSFVSNSGSITGLVSPFIAGAAATAMMATKGAMNYAGGSLIQKAGASLGNLNQSLGERITGSIFGGAKQPIPNNEKIPEGGSNPTTFSTSSMVKQAAAMGMAGGGGGGESPPPPPPEERRPARSAKDQAKRGAIINQMKGKSKS